MRPSGWREIGAVSTRATCCPAGGLPCSAVQGGVQAGGYEGAAGVVR